MRGCPCYPVDRARRRDRVRQVDAGSADRRADRGAVRLDGRPLLDARLGEGARGGTGAALCGHRRRRAVGGRRAAESGPPGAAARADVVLALDYPRWLSLLRLLRRTARRLRSGERICNGNTETLRGVVGRDSIIAWHFRSFAVVRREIAALESAPSGPPVVRLTSQRATDAGWRTCAPRYREPVDSFRINADGPHTRPLSGAVHVGGAKNSALKLMAAALLAPGGRR